MIYALVPMPVPMLLIGAFYRGLSRPLRFARRDACPDACPDVFYRGSCLIS